MPAILSIVGKSGSGKTTLLCAVIPHIVAAGFRVSTIKHAHHTFDIDKPGTGANPLFWIQIDDAHEARLEVNRDFAHELLRPI